MAKLSRTSKTVSVTVMKKKANMQLQNIDFYPRMSDETPAFNADLLIYFDGRMFKAPCGNSGHGEETNIYWNNVPKDLYFGIKAEIESQIDTELEDYLKKHHFSLNHRCYKTVESVVNNLLAEYCDTNNL